MSSEKHRSRIIGRGSVGGILGAILGAIAGALNLIPRIDEFDMLGRAFTGAVVGAIILGQIFIRAKGEALLRAIAGALIGAGISVLLLFNAGITGEAIFQALAVIALGAFVGTLLQKETFQLATLGALLGSLIGLFTITNTTGNKEIILTILVNASIVSVIRAGIALSRRKQI